jgi:hypothetical protein
MRGTQAVLFEGFLDAIGNRPKLRRAETRAQQERVGKCAETRQIEERDVGGFLVLRGRNRGAQLGAKGICAAHL